MCGYFCNSLLLSYFVDKWHLMFLRKLLYRISSVHRIPASLPVVYVNITSASKANYSSAALPEEFIVTDQPTPGVILITENYQRQILFTDNSQEILKHTNNRICW